MVNDYERWDFWNRETENDKSEVLERFYQKISQQKDLEPEFKLVNDNFFKLD